jgi:hypothetical protein
LAAAHLVTFRFEHCLVADRSAHQIHQFVEGERTLRPLLRKSEISRKFL